MANTGSGIPSSGPTATGAVMSREQKRRRIQNSSVVGSDVITTGSTPSDGSSWTAERFRVGIPALQLLPLWSTELPSDSPALLRFRELLPNIHRILHARGIEFRKHKTALLHRFLPYSSPTANDLTVLITAYWKNDDEDGDVWLRAAKDIRKLLIQSSGYMRNVKVELMSRHLTREKVIFVVEREHPLVAAWPTVNPLIHEIIDRSPALKSSWVSIDVLRIGYLSEASYPTPVTILITVDWGLDRCQWVADERRIKDMLLAHDLKDVEVMFERGELDAEIFTKYAPNEPPRGPTGIHRADYSQRATMGSEFGTKNDFTLPGGEVVPGPTGTIGGYVDLVHPDGSTEKLAVTTYESVRWGLPGFGLHEDENGEVIENVQDSKIQKVDEEGLPPASDLGKSMHFESPSRFTHHSSLAAHEQEIKDRKHRIPGHEPQPLGPRTVQAIIETTATRERKQKYFDQGDHKLGYVYFASGRKVRSATNSVIDIALLKVRPGKEGSNSIPEDSTWRCKGLMPPIEYCGQILDETISCADCDGCVLYRYGAATGAITGHLSSIKSDIHPRAQNNSINTPYSTEHCFVANPDDLRGKFSERGDSGSFIFTLYGQWVGVQWGGKTVSNGEMTPISYVTDAKAVLEYLGGIETEEGWFEARLSGS